MKPCTNWGRGEVISSLAFSIFVFTERTVENRNLLQIFYTKWKWRTLLKLRFHLKRTLQFCSIFFFVLNKGIPKQVKISLWNNFWIKFNQSHEESWILNFKKKPKSWRNNFLLKISFAHSEKTQKPINRNKTLTNPANDRPLIINYLMDSWQSTTMNLLLHYKI